MSEGLITISIAYHTHKEYFTVPIGSSLLAALINNPLYQRYLLEVPKPHIGIFGKVVNSDYILVAGDRIELYFPLVVDPLQKRKGKVKSRYRRKN
jgi:putative ubiquitin-RnfH superfamily antitoxin RatB of RatAB toxin-antitoxin module